jgi:hypothetical protein
MISSDGALSIPAHPKAQTFDQLLVHYEQHRLFACARDTGESRWSFTSDGNGRLLVGQILRNPKLVAARRQDVETKDMSCYELLTLLDEEGWECRIVGGGCEAEAKHSPYKTFQRDADHTQLVFRTSPALKTSLGRETVYRAAQIFANHLALMLMYTIWLGMFVFSKRVVCSGTPF